MNRILWFGFYAAVFVAIYFNTRKPSQVQEVIPVYVRFGDRGFNFPDLIEVIQIQVDHEERSVLPPQYHVELKDCITPGSHECDNYTRDQDYSLELLLLESIQLAVDENEPQVQLWYNFEAIEANDLPFYATQAILYHLLAADAEVAGVDSKFKKRPVEDVTVRAPDLWPVATFIERVLLYYNVTDIRWQKNKDDTVEVIVGNGDSAVEFPTWDDMCSAIEEALGLPEHPNNNVGLKIRAMQRAERNHLL